MGKRILKVSVFVFFVVFATIVGFDAGYSKAFDDYAEASECKPSWRWRQRF